MNPDQLQEIKDSLKETVVQTVNGKIDKIHKILEGQNEVVNEMKTKIETHIENDTTWKEEYTPYIKGLANVSGAGKILITVAVGLSSVIGLIVAIKTYFFH
jgi:hypothetical protein